MDRRDFVKRCFAGLGLLWCAERIFRSRVATALTGSIEATPRGQSPGVTPVDLVAVRNGTPQAMLDAALTALGGIGSFVKQGQSVLIKPNIGWNQTVEWGANTHPDLVGHLVTLCLKAGARRVLVFDHSCDRWERCIETSGIGDAVRKAGGVLIADGGIDDYTEVAIRGGVALAKVRVHREILRADVLINVPVLKHHASTKMTCAAKNLMGCVWDRREYHAKGLHEAIVDFLQVRKPDLNIVDAYRVMKAGGPRGISLADVEKRMMLLASRDIVAVDAAAARILGVKEGDVPYIKQGSSRGFGTSNLDKLKIERIIL